MGSYNAVSSLVFVILLIITGVIYYYTFNIAFLIVGFLISIIITSAIKVADQWERAIVLRVGKFRGIKGPGLFLIIPILETIPEWVDLRVRTTDFAAEKTLTKDNVPVDVDAVNFWRVVDTKKAILEVEHYREAVSLASQTALRDLIGKTDLSKMLVGRDILDIELKKMIDERTHPWGIQVKSVEIRDVKIPAELQDAMARVATSEREKDARVILAESEKLAAEKMLDAAHIYEGDPFAMQLRALNMMYEIGVSGKNIMLFIPTESRGFGIPTPIGVIGLEDLKKYQKYIKKRKIRRKKK